MDEVANGDLAEQEGWTALPRRGGRGLKLGAVRKARAAGVDTGAYPKNRGRSLYRCRVILVRGAAGSLGGGRRVAGQSSADAAEE